MPTTLNPTCPLCGLRYNDRSLLELHFREDHRPRDRHAEPEPDAGDSGDSATSPPRSRGPVPIHSPATGLFPGTGTGTGGGTAAAAPRRPRRGWARTALHRVVGALRYADDELMRAHEALSRERRVNGDGSDRVAGGGRA
jgi:hypothetical protein